MGGSLARPSSEGLPPRRLCDASKVIVGYDAIPEAVKAIQRGSALKADVAQQPRDLGAKTIEAISKHFSGAPVEKNIAVPVKIVDANSLK